MVNPMPLRIPSRKTCCQFMSGGKRQMPLATATRQNNVTPKGFPTIKPAVMPRLFVLVRFYIQSAPTKIPEFASAKIGKRAQNAKRKRDVSCHRNPDSGLRWRSHFERKMNPRRGHVSVRWAVRRGKNKNGSFAIQYQYVAWWSANLNGTGMISWCKPIKPPCRPG